MASPSEIGRRPLLALTLGDPAGIGPEVALAAARDPRVRAAADLVLVGPARLRPADLAALAPWATGPASPGYVATGEEADAWEIGRASAASGRHALAALRAGHELALAGRVAALVTAPVSKTALHLAGEEVEGQTELLGRWCGVERFEMVAVAGALRVMLLTRHLPLRRAIEAIRTEAVVEHLALFSETLSAMGFAAPRLALAGLNPHAGEGGRIGTEDRDLLAPAVEVARGAGWDVEGPISPDTVFLQASEGRWDGVLALYHDQAFIPVKLLSRGRGLTLVAGLPYLRVSPVHGTAFDIAGTGRASPENLVHAVLETARWTAAKALRAGSA